MRLPLSLRAGLAAILSASALCAEDATIVNWDGTGVQETTALAVENHESKLSSEVHTFVLAEDRTWLPASIEFPSDKSSHFLLALSSSAGTGPAAPQLLQLEPRGGQGTLSIIVQGSLDAPPRQRGILAFAKDHFLEGADAASRRIRFNAMSRLAFRGILDGRAPVARWLVRDGEKWWVSEATLTPQMAYNESEERELINPESVRWAEYDASAEPLGETSAEFQNHAFHDITALGIFWDSYGTDTVLGGTSFVRMALETFTAQASW